MSGTFSRSQRDLLGLRIHDSRLRLAYDPFLLHCEEIFPKCIQDTVAWIMRLGCCTIWSDKCQVLGQSLLCPRPLATASAIEPKSILGP